MDGMLPSKLYQTHYLLVETSDIEFLQIPTTKSADATLILNHLE